MQNDLEKLQGTWNVTALESNGQQMPEITFSGATIVITGNQFRSTGMGAIYEGTLALDPTQKPKAFDMLFTAGHAQGVRHPGIYKLDGDSWTLCVATQGSERPQNFSTAVDSGLALETLQRSTAVRSPRSKAAKAGANFSNSDAPAQHNEEPSGPVTELEGEWEMTSAVFNGIPMDPNLVKWCKRITRGNVTKVVAGPQVFLNATFSLDHSTNPQSIDYVNLEGASKGKAQAGIFSLHGGELKTCMAAPGEKRPNDFSSHPGDNRTYTVWRRVKQ
jgi:uncharacterized protein (TIGR03067 family)